MAQKKMKIIRKHLSTKQKEKDNKEKCGEKKDKLPYILLPKSIKRKSNSSRKSKFY